MKPSLPALHAMEQAASVVYRSMPPTPQYRWPLLCREFGADIWVKHENHTPVGAFKVRGGLVYFADLAASKARPHGVIAATRGNHGQSVGLAARLAGIAATIVVPHGNSREKNAAMGAQGVTLIEHGADFQASLEYARQLAAERDLHLVPSYHPLLVAGVATGALELLRAVPDLQRVYVPIGLGSGICAMVAAREALGLATEIVGVVSSHARAYSESFTRKQMTEAAVSTVLADGMACRTPEPMALEVICKAVERIVEVSDQEVAAAIRMLYECTHNVAEGAGAAALAAALQERPRNQGRRVAVLLTGGNIDRELLMRALDQW
ncbi:threonine dehydratase [Desulfurispirillum indicum]|uniref:threonine dehydratase n=1 Tax=Desulfurispirillum indicum TaxID=936456 RepID=UPI001CFA301B|nr:threonine dehydratase [Desulfurispirillum indicum]UCZ55676.1 threonine dehydratase [Desulfurispirillum indicum]